MKDIPTAFHWRPQVEAAINASALCGGCVFFPPARRGYRLGRTVAVTEVPQP